MFANYSFYHTNLNFNFTKDRRTNDRTERKKKLRADICG